MPCEFHTAMTRRRALGALGAATLYLRLGSQRALGAGSVANFIETLGDKAIRQLAGPGISDGDRETRFRALLKENFDIARISRFVLGRHARNITKEQMAEFTKLYEDIAVFTYAHLFAAYSGQGFKVGREIGDPGDRYQLVMTEIQPVAGKPSVKLDWQVLVNGDSYAVVDVRVEGASMAMTQREEYTAVLDKNGGDIPDLLAQLRIKLEKLRAQRANT